MLTVDTVDLLDASVRAASSAVARAAYSSDDRPTPCTRWDLRTLVRHLADSAATIGRLLYGRPDLGPPPAGCAAAAAVLAELAGAVDDLRRRQPNAATMTALVGSYELSLHAWDIAESTQKGPTLDEELIMALLINARSVSVGIRRDGLFGAERRPADEADPEQRLVALFGRSRDWRRRSGQPA